MFGRIEKKKVNFIDSETRFKVDVSRVNIKSLRECHEYKCVVLFEVAVGALE